MATEPWPRRSLAT